MPNLVKAGVVDEDKYSLLSVISFSRIQCIFPQLDLSAGLSGSAAVTNCIRFIYSLQLHAKSIPRHAP